jgi:cyclic pyranopterin phosphate synthase
MNPQSAVPPCPDRVPCSPAPQPGPRAPRSIRISVTDRCDLACVYCAPDRAEPGALRASERLDDDAIVRVVRALVDRGTRRVRLTGGEPLVRPRLVGLVERLARLELEDLALTTNGTMLERLARPLADAGLHRVNVSLDSLAPERFALLTGGGDLGRVLRGVEAARGAGYREIGLNIVLVRGVNDDEAGALLDWAWARDLVPRFIELMKIGGASRFWPDGLVSAEETFERLGARVTGALAAAGARPDRGPARYREAADGSGRRVGFITGSSHTFCGNCDRMRLTADGKLRPCLAKGEAVDIRDAARAGDADGIGRGLAAAMLLKPSPREWRGCCEPSASGVDIGATGG